MSAIEENVVIVPWVGPLSYKNTLSVIVVSQNVEIIQRIAEGLSEVHRKGDRRWKLIVLRSFHLDEVVKQASVTGLIAIDFVIIAIDTSRMFCLEWAKSMLNQVHPDLRSRRVVLVNAYGLPVNAMGVSAEELIAIQSDFKLDILTADVQNSDGATYLARRLLKYLEVSIGVHTGIPNINV
ncbi:Uncharacterized protein OBRU01_01765 [Operophtera brumata]|uniref:Uncharacterized protein n=1 Tax=Operophtera brumata TaxID=104452 RepID=A0A0L7LTU0_OPEBR|nr:Uncharacterized protein OBRU01_01765 [Operophtera brumata]